MLSQRAITAIFKRAARCHLQFHQETVMRLPTWRSLCLCALLLCTLCLQAFANLNVWVSKKMISEIFSNFYSNLEFSRRRCPPLTGRMEGIAAGWCCRRSFKIIHNLKLLCAWPMKFGLTVSLFIILLYHSISKFESKLDEQISICHRIFQDIMTSQHFRESPKIIYARQVMWYRNSPKCVFEVI